jgi:anhydro-N-acetylmuramic acid kinase
VAVLERFSAIGAISGTSMDGIDVAWIETDGDQIAQPLGGRTLPYPAALKDRLLALLQDPSVAEREPLIELEAAVTAAFGDAIAEVMADVSIARGRATLIGLHGQTIYHRPEKRFTRQLGNGRLLAQRFGIDVVDQFRLADVAAGGQGAPLVPLYHAALARELEQPLMVLNLGGVGNVTYIDGETIMAFDTGPGSALIDDCVRAGFGLPFDDGGGIARTGHVDQSVLGQLLGHPFFALPPPKSLDRNAFHGHAAAVERLAPADAVATLTAFTIEATAAALAHVPKTPRRWLVGGGGRLNGHIMEGLRARLGVPVEPVEVAGWDGDLLEAQCFGFLAARSVRGLPLSLPQTTGVPRPMPGGRLCRA